jgi:hypothetical protein
MKRFILLVLPMVAATLLMFTFNSVSAQVSGVQGVKPGVVSAVPLNRAGTYCHLRFPAIQPSSLDTAKPELKSAESGDMIDFYGPCDHDPVGYDEVCRQRVQNSQRQYCDGE